MNRDKDKLDIELIENILNKKGGRIKKKPLKKTQKKKQSKKAQSKKT